MQRASRPWRVLVAEPLRFDVVVVGAGLAGSALALSLAGRDLAVALIEARPLHPEQQPQEREVDSFDPRVSALTPRSIAQLEQLGVWSEIESYRSCPYRHMTVWDADGTGRIEFDCAEIGAQSLGTIVENRAITGALLRRLQQAPGLSLFAPAGLAACAPDDEGGTTVELEDGQVLIADLLVAADGAQSRVRTLFEFATREWDYGHRAIVTTVQVERPHADTAWQRFLTSGPLALLPLPGDDERHFCSIVWSIDEALADGLLALEDDAFCAALGQASEGCLGQILAAAPRIGFPLRQRHAVDYVQQGVALVADAAHTIHPLAGQGINLGLQDVAVLAEEVLSASARGLSPGDLAVLKRYQRRRKGENLAMMAAMDGFRHLFGQQRLPLRWLRNAGLRGVNSVGPLKQQLIRRAMGLDGLRPPA